MAELAREEIEQLQQQLDEQGDCLKILLLPKDPLDEKNIMLEVGRESAWGWGQIQVVLACITGGVGSPCWCSPHSHGSLAVWCICWNCMVYGVCRFERARAARRQRSGRLT